MLSLVWISHSKPILSNFSFSFFPALNQLVDPLACILFLIISSLTLKLANWTGKILVCSKVGSQMEIAVYFQIPAPSCKRSSDFTHQQLSQERTKIELLNMKQTKLTSVDRIMYLHFRNNIQVPLPGFFKLVLLLWPKSDGLLVVTHMRVIWNIYYSYAILYFCIFCFIMLMAIFSRLTVGLGFRFCARWDCE